MAGQSSLAPGITLDWIVIQGAGYYNYYYEVENTTAGALTSFTARGSFVSAGEFCCTLDLDFTDLGLQPINFGALGHSEIAFANLGLPGAVETEVETSIFGPLADSIALEPTGVTWNYSSFPANSDTQILYARSLAPPHYGSALVNGNLAIDLVPVPVPEPATWSGACFGVLGLLALARRRDIRADGRRSR